MYCSNCGKEIQEGQKFCPNCGAPAGNSFRSAFQQAKDSAKEGMENVGDKARDAFEQAKTTASDVGSQIDSAVDQIRKDFSGNTGPALTADRSLAAYILLSIITCGIYGYYFIYSVAKDVNIACADDGEETAGLGMFILLSIVTCGFYSIYWMYKLGNRLTANAPRYGMSFQENGSTIVLWKVFGLLICCIGTYIGDYILIKNTNAICDAYNKQHGLY